MIPRPIILNVTSPYENPMSATIQRTIWNAFIQHGSHHSYKASTLPYIIRRCEQEGIPYRLLAYPGMGYHISRVDPVQQPEMKISINTESETRTSADGPPSKGN